MQETYYRLFQKKIMGVFDGTFSLPPPPMRFNYCLAPPPIRSDYQPTPPPTLLTLFFLEKGFFKEEFFFLILFCI